MPFIFDQFLDLKSDFLSLQSFVSINRINPVGWNFSIRGSKLPWMNNFELFITAYDGPLLIKIYMMVGQFRSYLRLGTVVASVLVLYRPVCVTGSSQTRAD